MKFSIKDLNYPDKFNFKKIIGPSNLFFEKPSPSIHERTVIAEGTEIKESSFIGPTA